MVLATLTLCDGNSQHGSDQCHRISTVLGVSCGGHSTRGLLLVLSRNLLILLRWCNVGVVNRVAREPTAIFITIVIKVSGT